MFNSNITNLTLPDKIENINLRMSQMEARFSDMGYSFKNIVQSEVKAQINTPRQDETMPSLHTAICMETIDPFETRKG